ncbi:hypothetical protein AZI98_18425 [Aeribacillus pallidus]|uniref:Uncharacterized protein n=1 Tax=Aeribacillus pallidus TaxID=33936 RepID=A0A167YXV7_9BACI|nr:hypothetical protein AZI98_18425 [Aeribacillus pallidus]
MGVISREKVPICKGRRAVSLTQGDGAAILPWQIRQVSSKNLANGSDEDFECVYGKSGKRRKQKFGNSED